MIAYTSSAIATPTPPMISVTTAALLNVVAIRIPAMLISITISVSAAAPRIVALRVVSIPNSERK